MSSKAHAVALDASWFRSTRPFIAVVHLLYLAALLPLLVIISLFARIGWLLCCVFGRRDWTHGLRPLWRLPQSVVKLWVTAEPDEGFAFIAGTLRDQGWMAVTLFLTLGGWVLSVLAGATTALNANVSYELERQECILSSPINATVACQVRGRSILSHHFRPYRSQLHSDGAT
jgi:hypothetical protein